MNTRLKLITENIFKEILLDIDEYGSNSEAFIFYHQINNIKYYLDFERAYTDEPTLEFDSDQIEIDIFEKYQEAKNKGLLIPGYTNIINDNESIELLTLKDILKIVITIVYEGLSNDILTILTYMSIKNISQNKLANLMGVSRQYLSSYLKGNESPLNEDRKKQISEILEFDYSEYNKSFSGWSMRIEDFIKNRRN